MFNQGDRVGSYEVIRRLSAGGMASLYLAKRVGAAGFARPVALKVIHPHLAENDEFSAMFVDEANISARIDHPNVVHVEELGQLKNGRTLFLAMEYVDGRLLAQLVRALGKMQRRMSPEVAVSVVAQVAAGLHAAHEVTDDDGRPLNVVHRDVTPHNVLVSYEGHVKIIDFGIAKSSQRLQTTQKGMVKGKVRFMSPEQAWAKPVDRRSDIFSLGIVMWELLTLKKLFDGPDDLSVIHQLKDPHIEPPSKMGAASNPALDAAVLKALATKPEDCPQTALELRKLLLDAVPRAQTIDTGELGSLMKAAVPKAPLRNSLEQPVSSSDPSGEGTSKPASRHSVAPPSFDALAVSTVEDSQLDVDRLFGDNVEPSIPTTTRRRPNPRAAPSSPAPLRRPCNRRRATSGCPRWSSPASASSP